MCNINSINGFTMEYDHFKQLLQVFSRRATDAEPGLDFYLFEVNANKSSTGCNTF